MGIWSEIAQHIGKTTGSPFTIRARRVLGGGCINEAYRIDDQQRVFFVKLHDEGGLSMFEACGRLYENGLVSGTDLGVGDE